MKSTQDKKNTTKANIAIVGTGYVGLTTGAILAAAGYKVYCIDVDEQKIETIRQGKAHFYEAGLDNIVLEAVESGNLIPTLSYEEAIPDTDIAFITVGTPARDDGSVDLTYILQATRSIGEQLNTRTQNRKDEHGDYIVSIKSTVPVGTGTQAAAEIANVFDGDFSMASCPEFLAEGSAVLDTLIMDRIVIGADKESTQEVIESIFKDVNDYAQGFDLDSLAKYAGVYRQKLDKKEIKPYEQRVLRIGLESAELVKVTANTFLATKISFANMIARICDKTGADITEVMDGIGADKRIGRDFLYAGLGWGGGCFPKDVSGLISFAEEIGVDLGIAKEASKLNFSQANYVLEKTKDLLGDDLQDQRVGILGLSFKPGTDDVRVSPAINLIKGLAGLGVDVVATDPQAIATAKKELEGTKLEFANDPYETASNADLLILATDWPEYNELDFAKISQVMNAKNIIDARNRWDKAELEGLGFRYTSLGRQ